MVEWMWALAAALTFAATAPVALRASRSRAPHSRMALAFYGLGYLLLLVFFVADVLPHDRYDATLRFAGGCVAGLGVGAVLGALWLFATGCRSHN